MLNLVLLGGLWLSGLMCFCTQAVQGQTLDPSFYLSDSLERSTLTPQDLALLDSLLPAYHSATEEEERLMVLEQVLENAANDVLVSNYSRILIAEAQDNLRYLGSGYNYRGLYVSNLSQHEESRRLYRQALACFNKVDYGLGKGYALNNLGASFHRFGNPDSALFYYDKGLRINEELGDSMGISALRFNMAGIYEDEGRLIEAIDYYQESLKVFEALGNVGGVAYAYNNIANLFERLEDYEKSISYQEKSLVAFETLGHRSGVAYSMNNLGCLYRELEQMDTALYFLGKSLAIRDTLGQTSSMISTMNNIALINESQGNYGEARAELERALALCTEEIDQNEVANTLKNLAGMDIRDGQWDLARKRLDEALAISQETRFLSLVRDVAEYRMEVAQHDEDWSQAYAMQQLYYAMRDSLLDDETANTVRLREATYNFEKEALADSLANEVEKKLLQATHDESLVRARIYTWAGIIGAILMLVLAVVLLRSNRRRKVHNEQLAEKNAENELLLGEIHHRVKNNLQVISSLLSLQEKNLTDVSAKKAILEGKERVKSMGLIHKMLYQNDSFSGIEMNHYVTTLVNELLDTFGRPEVELNTDFSAIRLDVDTAVPVGLIVNELVINALKYAYTQTEKPRLAVRLEKQSENNLLLEVVDNGSGQADTVMQSGSFGMKLIRSLTRQLSGSLDISSDNGLRYAIAIKDFKEV